MMDRFGLGKGAGPAAAAPHTAPRQAIQPPSLPTFPLVPSRTLRVVTAPSRDIVLDNVLAVPRDTFYDGQFVICDGRFVFTARVVPALPQDQLGVGGTQREWAQWSFNTEVRVDPFDIFAGGNKSVYLTNLDLEIDFYSRSKANERVYDHEDLIKQLMSLHKNKVFSPRQIFAMEREGVNFKVTVRSTKVTDLDGETELADHRGILVPQTSIVFHKANDSKIKLKGVPSLRANLLPRSFSLEDMGIGGLDLQFGEIISRAFASRVVPPQLVEKMGIKHVKGLLLYGPPGTGKTLVARKIGKLLNTVEPKVVNGPEMLSKYVGGSEENIRKLFKEAEDEQRAKGDESNLHIIIFDELDAVFKQRGSRSDGTGVGDNVVNQLLAKMDGVDELNNILVIGMTNRRDLIDSALLRPGRFEIQLEIPLPDEKGRKQILMIHTEKMRDSKLVAPDVDMDELVSRTKNYSGAELEGLVKAATSFALGAAQIREKTGEIKLDVSKIRPISRDDFLNGLERVKPAYGVSEVDLSHHIGNGIIKYSAGVDQILTEGSQLANLVRYSKETRIASILLHGPPGSGKLALASMIAKDSDFPLIKIISPRHMAGMSEGQKLAHMQNIFEEAYKSPLNVILIEQLEHLFDWVDVGPRFSNMVLQAIMVFVRQVPPEGRRLLVLATTSRYEVCERLGLTRYFSEEIYVPTVPSVANLEPIFEFENFLEPSQRAQVLQDIRSRTGADVLGLGIKLVKFYIEKSKLLEQPAESFTDLVVEAIQNKPGTQGANWPAPAF